MVPAGGTTSSGILLYLEVPDKGTSKAGGGNPISFIKNQNQNLITIAISDVLFIPWTF